jgi:hypothetical protein
MSVWTQSSGWISLVQPPGGVAPRNPAALTFVIFKDCPHLKEISFMN